MNFPEYHFLPAPLWLVTTLHLVTLTLHFVAMNFLFGALIVIVFGKMTDKWNDATVAKFARLFPAAMAATVTLGVAPLLFVQLVYPRQLYAASITSAWLWLLIVPAAIVAYYSLYGSASAGGERAARRGVFLAVALAAAAYVSFVYSTVFSMGERPDLYRSLYRSNQSGWVVNTHVGEWAFRWLHMLTGAVTVGGFFVGVLGRESAPAFALGKRFFLWGMAAAIVTGLAYLFTLGDHILPLMRSAAIWVLMTGIVLSLLSLHFFFRRRFVISGALLFVSLAGMVFTRHVLRLIVLRNEFDPGTIPIAPQWSVFAVFLVFFVVALGLVGWMLRAFLSRSEQEA